VLDPAAETLTHARRGKRLALLLGSEDRGLGEPWVSVCTRRITLPMSRGTDSLNVAAAAAVFLYHFTRA
jgi:tRNA G18 (ribose-2'-O)-methylase SpoU